MAFLLKYGWNIIIFSGQLFDGTLFPGPDTRVILGDVFQFMFVFDRPRELRRVSVAGEHNYRSIIALHPVGGCKRELPYRNEYKFYCDVVSIWLGSLRYNPDTNSFKHSEIGINIESHILLGMECKFGALFSASNECFFRTFSVSNEAFTCRSGRRR